MVFCASPRPASSDAAIAAASALASPAAAARRAATEGGTAKAGDDINRISKQSCKQAPFFNTPSQKSCGLLSMSRRLNSAIAAHSRAPAGPDLFGTSAGGGSSVDSRAPSALNDSASTQACNASSASALMHVTRQGAADRTASSPPRSRLGEAASVATTASAARSVNGVVCAADADSLVGKGGSECRQRQRALWRDLCLNTRARERLLCPQRAPKEQECRRWKVTHLTGERDTGTRLRQPRTPHYVSA